MPSHWPPPRAALEIDDDALPVAFAGALGALLLVVVLGVLRSKPWQRAETEAHRRADNAAPRETLAVGFLPVTCHLTCPVTDFASKTSPSTRFESQRFTDFPTVVETMKSGRLQATLHDRAAGDEAARAGREGEDRLSGPPRRIDGDGAIGPDPGQEP